jgi:hypothetical protein
MSLFNLFGTNSLENDALKVENDALKVENDALKVENDALKVEKDALKEDLERLKRTWASGAGASGAGASGAGASGQVDKTKTTWKGMHHPEWPGGAVKDLMDKDRIMSTGEYYVNQDGSCSKETLQDISPGDTFMCLEQTTKGKKGKNLSRVKPTNNLMVGIVTGAPNLCDQSQSPDPGGQKRWHVIKINWMGVYPLPNGGIGFSNAYNNTGQLSIKEQTHSVHILDYLGQ